MHAELLVSRILDDEALTRDLDSEAAALLVEWLVRQAEKFASQRISEAEAMRRVDVLCRYGRNLAQRVSTDGEQEDVLRRILEQQEYDLTHS